MDLKKTSAFLNATDLTEQAIGQIKFWAQQSIFIVSNPYGHKAIVDHFKDHRQKPSMEMKSNGDILGTDVNVIRVFGWIMDFGAEVEMGACKPLEHLPFLVAALDENEFADACEIGLIQLFDSLGCSDLSLKRFRRVLKALHRETCSSSGHLLDMLMELLEPLMDGKPLFNDTDEDEEGDVIEVPAVEATQF